MSRFTGLSQGETELEALNNIQEAIRDYLIVVEELNQELETRYVEIA
jgi:predicted RNase H-like HicB family nuclease